MCGVCCSRPFLFTKENFQFKTFVNQFLYIPRYHLFKSKKKKNGFDRFVYSIVNQIFKQSLFFKYIVLNKRSKLCKYSTEKRF